MTIPAALLNNLYQQALDAFPQECCGWISNDPKTNQPKDIHVCINQQDSEQNPQLSSHNSHHAYLIRDNDLLSFVKSFDSTNPPSIVYHSHTDGTCYLSDLDHTLATNTLSKQPLYPVQHLIIGVTETTILGAALFTWSMLDHMFTKTEHYYPSYNHDHS